MLSRKWTRVISVHIPPSDTSNLTGNAGKARQIVLLAVVDAEAVIHEELIVWPTYDIDGGQQFVS